jgi:hypothetical protein
VPTEEIHDTCAPVHEIWCAPCCPAPILRMQHCTLTRSVVDACAALQALLMRSITRSRAQLMRTSLLPPPCAMCMLQHPKLIAHHAHGPHGIIVLICCARCPHTCGTRPICSMSPVTSPVCTSLCRAGTTLHIIMPARKQLTLRKRQAPGGSMESYDSDDSELASFISFESTSTSMCTFSTVT